MSNMTISDIYLLVLIMVICLAIARNFLSSETIWNRKGSFIATLIAFAIFIFGSFLLQVPIKSILTFFLTESELDLEGMTIFWTMASILFALLFYSFQCQKKGLNPWGKRGFGNLFIGVATCGVAFPVVIALGQGASFAIESILGREYTSIGQDTVRYVQSLRHHSLVLFLNSLGVVLFAPISEEILFRGFLQSWLRIYFRPFFAIFFSALCFSFIHFSETQGLANIELFFPLLFLGVLLGYLYERQQSLLASIALHSSFNLVSISIILAGGETIST